MVLKRSSILSLVLVAGTGCQETNRTQVVEPSATDAHSEWLGLDAVTSIAPAAHHRLVTTDADGTWLVEPVSEDPTFLDGASAPVRAATRLPDGRLMVATDGDLAVWGDYWGTADLADQLELPVTGLSTVGDDVWLGAADGLRLWRDGWLHAVTVGGRSPDGAFCAGPGRVWATDDRGVFGVDEADARFEVVASHDGGRADALATDAAGTFWAAVGGDLLRYDTGDDAWTTQVFPEPVVTVLADPHADGAFVLTDAAVYAVDATSVRRLDGVSPAPTARVDEAGRLLMPGDGGVLRVTADRVVVLVGLDPEAPLDGPVDVLLQPSDPDDVTAVTAWVDDVPAEVTPDPWRVRVDPSALSGDQHAVTAEVTWTDGARVAARPVGFDAAGTLVATWDTDIAPLHVRSCAICHDGGTRTLLDTRQAWQDRIDDILEEVTAKRMPLSGDKLTTAEIGLLQAWKDGGFP